MEHFVDALRGCITIHGREFPIYTGFMSPMHVDLYASVPNFSDQDDTNLSIANQLPSTDEGDPPTKWQRPHKQWKIDAIRGHANKNANLGEGFDVHKVEIIPNPILLAVNDSLIGEEGFDVTPSPIANHGEKFQKIRIERPDDPLSSKPLWIVDGQHRNLGLKDVQNIRTQEHPVVILLDENGEAYPHALIAKIFGQVTTNATQLDPEHDEWLQYCFNQGLYTGEGSTSRKYAMRTLLRMCTAQQLPGKNVNNSTYFRGRIPFHPKNRVRAGNSWRIVQGQGGFRGFNYSLCEPNITERPGSGADSNWVALLQKNLFEHQDVTLPDPDANAANNEDENNAEDNGIPEQQDVPEQQDDFQHTPTRCADAIITAIAALHQSDTGSAQGGNSHFFGTSYRIPLVDAWFKQLLRLIARRPETMDWNLARWRTFLRQRHFNTDWSNFGIPANSQANVPVMKRICAQIFTHLFEAEDPADVNGLINIDNTFNHDNTTLPQWMAGGRIRIRVRMRPSRPGNAPIGVSRSFTTFGQESTLSIPNNVVDEYDLVDIRCQSMNVQISHVCDGQNPAKLTNTTDPHSTSQVSVGAGVHLSKKQGLGVSPRVGNNPYFRVYYESYMNTGSHNIMKQ
jgi:hypothetical protein